MERKHVVLVGAYGIQNAGDDAPLLVVTRELRRRYPSVDFRFTVVGRHPDPLLLERAGAHFLANPEYESRAAAEGRWFRGFNAGDDREDLERIADAIRDADLVIAGAGNILVDISFDLFRGPISLLATYTFLADLYQTPFFLFGISVGPLRSTRASDLSAWIARRSHKVTCRDAASVRLGKVCKEETALFSVHSCEFGICNGDNSLAERLDAFVKKHAKEPCLNLCDVFGRGFDGFELKTEYDVDAGEGKPATP